MSDQLHAGCLGFASHPQAITPHLDRLASEGVCFERCYAQSPICTPSRTSLLSGQYNHNTGYFALNGPRPEHLPSYMSHFKENGYRTTGIGKLHTPDHPRNWLEDHLDLYGDTYFTVDSQPLLTGTDWIRDLEARGYLETDEFQMVKKKQITEPHERASLNPFKVSQEGWCVREAIRFIEEKDGPFCMQVSLERPHDSCTPAKEFWDMYPDDLELPDTLDAPCKTSHSFLEKNRSRSTLIISSATSKLPNSPNTQTMIWIKAFISGFLATLIFHQGLFTVFWLAGVVPMAPYNFAPTPPLGVPAVISLSFFGGLWGIVLWLILEKLSGLRFWLGHLAVGAIGPTVVAMLVVFPVKGIEVTAQSWVGGLLLNGFWGIGVAVFMRMFVKAEN